MTASTPRIAFITPLPTPYRQPLLERLARDGRFALEVLYCAREEFDRTYPVRVDPDLPHRFLSGWHPAFVSHKTFINHANLSVWGALSGRDFDVVVVPGYALITSQLAILWCLMHRVAYVMVSEAHDGTSKSAWKRAAKELIVRPLVKRAAAGLAIGSLAKDYLASYGLDPRRVFFFPNVPDVEAFAGARKKLVPRREEIRKALGVEGKRVSLFVGRLIPAKGVDVLIEAFRQLKARLDDCALLIVGDGMDEARLKRASRGLADVHFLGVRKNEQLPEIYAASDLLVLASRHEPYGVVVAEAMASSLPVVASSLVGCAPDLVREGANGHLVPSGDAGALADAMYKVLGDTRIAARMGAQSLELVRAWGYDFAVEQFALAIGEALRGPGDRE